MTQYSIMTHHRSIAAQVGIKNLTSRSKKLDSEIFQQQELLYTQDFSLDSLHRKLGRLEGSAPNKDEDKLLAQIQELKANLDTEQSTFNLLTAQLRKAEVSEWSCSSYELTWSSRTTPG